MMRRILAGLSLLVLSISSMAQQDGMMNFYPFGEMYNNPAHLINSGFVKASLNYNNKLPGYKNGPVSYYASYGGPLNPRRMFSQYRSNMSTWQKQNSKAQQALGGYVLSDSYGYYQYNSYMLNYAQKFNLSKEISLSFGLGAGIYNSNIKQDNFKVAVETDPVYQEYINYAGRFTMGDINFGAILHSPTLEAGIAVRHILADKMKLGETPDFAFLDESFTGFLKTRVKLNKELELIPALMGSYMPSLPLDLKVNFPFVYRDILMAGLGYTFNRSINLDLGLYYKKIFFGYSFEFITSALAEVSDYSYQIGIQYLLPFRKTYNHNIQLSDIIY